MRLQAAFGALNKAVLAVAVASTGAWPQWGGPNRDFKVEVTGLAGTWPAAGPPVLWRRPLGEGYSAIVADSGTLYTMYRSGALEVVVALSADTGQTLWEHRYDAPFRDGMNVDNGPGPHATPVIAGDRVFAAGAVGRLQALDKRTGRVAWVRDLWSDLGGTLVETGYSSSPLAYGDTIILPVGGPGHAVVALRQSDGAVVWKRHDFVNSPASPTLIRVGGQDQVVVFMAKLVAGLDPVTGDLLWQHPHDTRLNLNISTPAWDGRSLLFCSSAYDVGSRVLELSRVGSGTEVKQLWANRRFRVHKDDAIWIGDRVYGWSGDFGPSLLTAADGRTGKLAWQDRSFARASFLYADGKLIVLDEDGNLGLITLTETGPRVQARFPLMKGRSWTVPTLAGTRLFARDRQEIVALELGS